MLENWPYLIRRVYQIKNLSKKKVSQYKFCVFFSGLWAWVVFVPHSIFSGPWSWESWKSFEAWLYQERWLLDGDKSRTHMSNQFNFKICTNSKKKKRKNLCEWSTRKMCVRVSWFQKLWNNWVVSAVDIIGNGDIWKSGRGTVGDSRRDSTKKWGRQCFDEGRL